MSTSNKKYRHEIKFLISKKKSEVLKYKLSLFMKSDSHYKGSYNIRSLYYDDIYNSAYNEKVDGLLEREKYRIRIYNLDKSFISLELKGKDNDLTYKERDIITYEEYLLIINKEYDKINIDNRKLLEKFINKCKNKGLIPSIIVDYNRFAYIYDIEDVRITFDSDIKSGRYNYDLFDSNMSLFDVLEEDDLILEVKYNDRIPDIISKVIKSSCKIRVASSKFAMCMEKKGNVL
jgi:hypothetical protein